LAAAEGNARALLRGYSLGSLSMTCYGVGTEVKPAEEPEGAAGLPANLPPDQTNI
jgi:4,5-DOPA dioxygenase extradiol